MHVIIVDMHAHKYMLAQRHTCLHSYETQMHICTHVHMHVHTHICTHVQKLHMHHA